MRKIWETFGPDGGWTVPLKWADDLPAIRLSVTIEKEDDGYNYSNSKAWVVDEDSPLAPAFIGKIGSNGVGWLGGGLPFLEGWLETNFYVGGKRIKADLIRKVRELTRYCAEGPEEWLVEWLRDEVSEEMLKYEPT